ncbi:CCR4-NOT transcription complex subunit 1-like isoform X3 [Camellia sinensis]|uniref:CCR4-NOT transcription complex subunit 1-like isoform X3 n=1 Tax=Camellia sinensis TaxID=4442 RepID=UPI001036CF66|nr:CCR4-NOT transcription complex subunit 1-like isoform X3 [Camellia sinensis]XP_028103032.1 CCR4-NOT transcription complex subunit 1-like isoform X3 [Camellia sinensis]
MVISEQLLTDFCDELHLWVFEKIGIGLALADSENVEIRTSGQNFCMGQIEELWRNSAVIDSSEQIQNIIMFLIRSEGLSKHVDSFMQLLSLMEPKERTPLILALLLSDDFYDARNTEIFYGCRENEFDAILAEMVSETSMADIMSELGNGCTVDASHCNEVLSLFLPLTEATVSRILGTITRTHTGLEDNQNCCLTLYSAIGSSATCEASCLSSWNVHVLVDLIKQLAPNINWINVVENLDHESFYIPSEQACFLFMSIYLRACQVCLEEC